MKNVLKSKRKERGLTQSEIADELGITRSFYGHIETGKRNPTLILSFKIADFFDDNVENIFLKNENGS